MFVMGGLFGIVLFFIVFGVLWYHMLRKGLNFIRAYVYLKTYWQTESTGFANYAASTLGVFESRHHVREALQYADKMCGGLQLPVIQQALDLGYLQGNWYPNKDKNYKHTDS